MPTYRIKTPNGTFKVSSETELTDEQAYEAVMNQAQAAEKPAASAPAPTQEKPTSPSDDMSWYEKALVGAGHGAAKTYAGLRGLFPPGLLPKAEAAGYSPENEALYKKYHPGGWATAGELAGDVAMAAMPVAKGGKVLSKALSVVPGVAAVAPVAGDVLASATYSGAVAPGDRQEAALAGGVGAAGGRLLTGAIGKFGRPVKTSPITQMMLDEGIPLSPGQAGGKLAKALEGSVYNIPFMPGLRRSVRQAQLAGQEGAEDFLTDAGRIAANPAAHGLTDAQAQAWIRGAERINDTGASTVPIAAVASMLNIKLAGAPIAAITTLYGTALGRKFLLGQLPAQELLRQAPQLGPYVSQVMRAANQPDAPAEE